MARMVSLGDGFLATCAAGGIHTSEIELTQDDIGESEA
jgi:hypothetical protein